MDNSPLGKLSVELRRRMYERVLRQPSAISVFVDEEAPTVPYLGASANILALANTCKTIRTESLPVFYRVNTFRLVTGTFKAADTTRAADDFAHDDASESLAVSRSSYRNQAKRPQEPTLWKWFRQIGKQNARHLRVVHILLGTWDTSHPMHVEPALAIPPILAPVRNFFSKTEAACTIYLSLKASNTDLSETNIEDIRLPITRSRVAAEHMNRSHGERSRRLKRRAEHGYLEQRQCREGRDALDRHALALERLLKDIRVAAERCSVDLF